MIFFQNFIGIVGICLCLAICIPTSLKQVSRRLRRGVSWGGRMARFQQNPFFQASRRSRRGVPRDGRQAPRPCSGAHSSSLPAVHVARLESCTHRGRPSEAGGVCPRGVEEPTSGAFCRFVEESSRGMFQHRDQQPGRRGVAEARRRAWTRDGSVPSPLGRPPPPHASGF